jgi:uncharacterized membrane protein YeiH
VGAVTFIQVLSLTGVAFFAVSGALAAGRKSLDLLGVIVIAAVTAVGGGTLRDLLLGRLPVFWMREPVYLWVILAAALVTVAYVRRRRPPLRLLLVADGLGLALFTVMGAQIAENEGHSGIVVVLMGVMTGVAGGVIRDVLSAEVPLILRRGHLYATAAAVGTALYLALQAVGAPRDPAALAGIATIAALRFASIFLGLQLPVFSLAEEAAVGTAAGGPGVRDPQPGEADAGGRPPPG